MKPSDYFDVIVIGSGAAGLALAISLAQNYRIALLSKEDLFAGCSPHAQGGIAAVIEQTQNNLHSHITDTLIAGDGLCHYRTVDFVVRNGKYAIEWLMQQGVKFSLNHNKTFHLMQEGGHSQRRIFHVADHTGAKVAKTLTDQVLNHANITCFTQHIAVDLITAKNCCYGVAAVDLHQKQWKYLFGKATVIATGGASSVYLHTTNQDQASGDGIAMAWRAGCRIANMEFNQFHPTALYHPEANHFLITEAMRGEGAHLILPNGQRFMPNYHPRAELAPRDIVARAIDSEMKRHHLTHVYLDITHQPKAKVKQLFPTIYEYCLPLNIDITEQPIPIVPSAHYTCGGILTNLQGETDIKQLYAIGETACTGLHGANRMASNSILECLVFAMKAASHIQKHIKTHTLPKSLNLPTYPALPDENAIDTQKTTLGDILWQQVGIVRDNRSLLSAFHAIQTLEATIPYAKNAPVSKTGIELHNMLSVGQLIIHCALRRKESRGLHYNTDYPHKLNVAENTVIQKTVSS